MHGSLRYDVCIEPVTEVDRINVITVEIYMLALVNCKAKGE